MSIQPKPHHTRRSPLAWRTPGAFSPDPITGWRGPEAFSPNPITHGGGAQEPSAQTPSPGRRGTIPLFDPRLEYEHTHGTRNMSFGRGSGMKKVHDNCFEENQRRRISAGKKARVMRSARIKTRFVYPFFFSHVQFPTLFVSFPFWGTVSILTSHFVPSWNATVWITFTDNYFERFGILKT